MVVGDANHLNNLNYQLIVELKEFIIVFQTIKYGIPVF